MAKLDGAVLLELLERLVDMTTNGSIANAGAGDVSSLVDNGNGTFTHTAGGISTTINVGTGATEVVTNLVDNGNGTFTYTNEEGTDQIISFPAETTSTLVDNGDSTFTYTDEDGTQTTIDFSVAVNAGDSQSVITITAEGFTHSDGATNPTVVNVDLQKGKVDYAASSVTNTLVGTLNGSNQIFTVSTGAYVANTLDISVGGMRLTPVKDFTESSPSNGQFTFTAAPLSDDEVVVSYQYI